MLSGHFDLIELFSEKAINYNTLLVLMLSSSCRIIVVILSWYAYIEYAIFWAVKNEEVKSGKVFLIPLVNND